MKSELKEIYSRMRDIWAQKPHHTNDHLCSVCMLYLVTEIKLALQCKEGMMSGMQATISYLPTATSSHAPREQIQSLLKLLCGLRLNDAKLGTAACYALKFGISNQSGVYFIAFVKPKTQQQ